MFAFDNAYWFTLFFVCVCLFVYGREHVLSHWWWRMIYSVDIRVNERFCLFIITRKHTESQSRSQGGPCLLGSLLMNRMLLPVVLLGYISQLHPKMGLLWVGMTLSKALLMLVLESCSYVLCSFSLEGTDLIPLLISCCSVVITFFPWLSGSFLGLRSLLNVMNRQWSNIWASAFPPLYCFALFISSLNLGGNHIYVFLLNRCNYKSSAKSA